MASRLKERIQEADCLVFFDFEATSPSNTIISIGMVVLPKIPDSLSFYPWREKYYSRKIQTDNPIPPVIETLTGINEEILKKEGIPFSDAVKEIKDLLRPYKKKRFFSYGRGDLHYLAMTIDNSLSQEEFLKSLSNAYDDLEAHFRQFISRKNGSSYSLQHLAEFYGIETNKEYHDSLTDSLVLKEILIQYYRQKDKTMDAVLRNYENLKRIPLLDKRLALMSLDGKTKEEALAALWEEV